MREEITRTVNPIDYVEMDEETLFREIEYEKFLNLARKQNPNKSKFKNKMKSKVDSDEMRVRSCIVRFMHEQIGERSGVIIGETDRYLVPRRYLCNFDMLRDEFYKYFNSRRF